MYNLVDIIGGCLVGLVLVITILFHRRTRALDRRYFQRRWNKLQKLCSDRKNWYKAIIDADDLLDEALKQRHFRGKSTGERLVAAQHYFSANDAIWLSHKLKNKILDNDFKKLNKRETLDALAAYRSALNDLGALSADRPIRSKNGK